MTVRNGERINPLLVEGAKPAFEVCRPFVVGRPRWRARPPLINRPAPALDRSHQTRPLEYLAYRRGRRPGDPRTFPLEHE